MSGFPETTLQSEFYAPWPKYGKAFSHQLNESRSNAESLNPIVRAAGLDSSYTEVKNAAVAAFEIGEQDFHNKYRIFWDKVRDTFRIQENTGNTGVPSWTDRITIGSSGEVVGNFYVSSTGGSGISGITFKDGTLPNYTSDTLTFSKAEFYLSKDSVGKPLVNLVSSGGGSGVSAHNALSGLIAPADDHTQYIHIDGRRDFTANESMGNFKLTNLGTPTAGTDAARLKDIGPGFYGITAKQSNNLAKFRGLNVFNFGPEFYLTQNTGINRDSVTINLRDDVDDVALSGVGEANTGLSLGGIDIFAQKVGVQLQFKGLAAGSGITLTPIATTVTIASTGGPGFYGIFIRESDGNPRPYKNDTIIFDSSAFYLNSNSKGKPMVSFRGSSSGSGVSAHSALTGLIAPADDHTQYLRVDAFRPATHDFTFKQRVTAESFYLRGGGHVYSKGNKIGLAVSSGYDTVVIDANGLLVTDSGPPFPGIAGIFDTNTGLYWTDDDTLNFAAGGVFVGSIGRDGMNVKDKLEANAWYIGGGAGNIYQTGNGRLKLIAPIAFDVEVGPQGNRTVAFEKNETRFNKSVRAGAFYFNASPFGEAPRKLSFSFPASREWQVNHNLKTTDILYNVYTNRQISIIPEKADMSNPNTAFFYFATLRTGKVVLVG